MRRHYRFAFVLVLMFMVINLVWWGASLRLYIWKCKECSLAIEVIPRVEQWKRGVVLSQYPVHEHDWRLHRSRYRFWKIWGYACLIMDEPPSLEEAIDGIVFDRYSMIEGLKSAATETGKLGSAAREELSRRQTEH